MCAAYHFEGIFMRDFTFWGHTGRSGNQAVWSVGGKEPVIYWLSGQPGAKEGKVQTNQGKVQAKQGKVLRLAKEA